MAKKEIINIDGIDIKLTKPDIMKVKWIGQERYLTQLLAAWMVVDEKDSPMSPRLIGKPGVGKTTLAAVAANYRKQDIYIFQATVDTRPEDLLVVPIISDGNKISYHASSLVTAMVKGGVCILDEGNRMSEKSWASLAPLLDYRRYVESIIAGVKIHAHKDFRIVTTMNDDASTFEIPDYIQSRLQPQIMIDFPDKDEEYMILKEFLPFADDKIVHYIVNFLQKAHYADEKFSVRDGINIGRYISKRIKQNPREPLRKHFTESVLMIAGDDAMPYV